MRRQDYCNVSLLTSKLQLKRITGFGWDINTIQIHHSFPLLADNNSEVYLG